MASLRLAPVLRAKSVKAAPTISKRSKHDLVIQGSPTSSHTPAPVIRYGPPTGGRSAVSGHTVTVFGCTGFLGRYLVSKLGKLGTQVVVPYRDEDEKRHLKILGDLGQIVPMEWDARRPDQILECLRHSDVVYNLAGRDWETRNFSYEDINVKTAQSIASVAAQHGTPRLIHLSHLNASANSPSAFYRSKFEGERAVRDAFPEATIVRPAGMYGPEDWLLNAMARYPILFKLNGGHTKILPVHVMDVAAALATMLSAPLTSTSSTFALTGPAVHTYNSLLSLVSGLTMHPPSSAPTLPKSVAKLFATAVNRGLWWPTVSPDEIERKYIDDAGVDELLEAQKETKPAGWATDGVKAKMAGIDGEPVKTFRDLDIDPDHVEEHAIKYLRRYRSSSNFDMPVEIGELKPQKQYHVVP